MISVIRSLELAALSATSVQEFALRVARRVVSTYWNYPDYALSMLQSDTPLTGGLL